MAKCVTCGVEDEDNPNKEFICVLCAGHYYELDCEE